MLRFIFGHKKDKEDPADILDRDDKKPKKRKKKEQDKPWGKKERLIVLGILVITIVSSAVLAISAREWKLPGLPRIKLPVFKSETIVLEKDPIFVNRNKDDLESISNNAKEEFNSITLDLSGIYGLYVVDLNTGFSYGVNEDEEFQAASLIKLPVIAGLYMEAESGEISMDDIYVLKDKDKTDGSGSLRTKEEGTELTYRDLVKFMGQESDNTAFAASVGILGENNISALINDIGMWDTSYETNTTTPRDIGLYFRKLWEGRLVNESDASEITNVLTDTIYEDWIPANLPDNIKVAHKFGRVVHVVNDAGIIYIKDNPFVLVLLSKGIIEAEANTALPEIAEAIYKIHLGTN